MSTERAHSEVCLEDWPRRTTYEFFKDFADPFFNVTANVDVTHRYRSCRQNGYNFSLAVLYDSLAAANEIREFRIRSLNGQLVEFDRIHATHTILNDDDSFSFAYFEMQEDRSAFVANGIAAREHYRKLRTFDVEADRIDLIYYSAIPWVSFTSIKHASRLDNSMTVPRIVFGKYFDQGDQLMMPVSVEANHSIMDGVHVGRFYRRFQELLDSV